VARRHLGVRPAGFNQRLQHCPALIGQHGLPRQKQANAVNGRRFRR
jgi:hypothetical protein